MDNAKLAHMIELFLQVNPEPSDQQFHALAQALGVDKETLEAVAYEMLGDEIHHEQEEGDDAQLNEHDEGVSTHFPETEEEENFGIVIASTRLLATKEIDASGSTPPPSKGRTKPSRHGYVPVSKPGPRGRE